MLIDRVEVVHHDKTEWHEPATIVLVEARGVVTFGFICGNHFDYGYGARNDGPGLVNDALRQYRASRRSED